MVVIDFQNQQKRCVAFDMFYIRFTSHPEHIWVSDSPEEPDTGEAKKMYDIYFETLPAGKVPYLDSNPEEVRAHHHHHHAVSSTVRIL